MKIQIKSIAGTVLFVGDFSSISEAIVSAIKKCANLRGADLCDANLRGADLRDADLCGADLCGANLRGADLCDANLRDANLRGADLCDADLCDANLRDANLRGADLRDADLCDADLCDANLRGADLRDADLRGAKNAELTQAMTLIVPQGDLIGWKKCQAGVIVKLKIPAGAKRSNAAGRKCRAEYAEVLEVIGAKVGQSAGGYGILEFKKGETVKPDRWDDNRWNECSNGIHFFITREEAEAYQP